MSEYEMSVGSDDGTCHEKLALWKFYDLVDRAAVMGGGTPHFSLIIWAIL